MQEDTRWDSLGSSEGKEQTQKVTRAGAGYLTHQEKMWQSCNYRTVAPATGSLSDRPQQGLFLLLERSLHAQLLRGKVTEEPGSEEWLRQTFCKGCVNKKMIGGGGGGINYFTWPRCTGSHLLSHTSMF